MNNLVYFRMVWKMNRGFAIFSMISLGLLQILILYLVTTFDTQSMLNSIVGQMPEKIKFFLNESFFNTLTVKGAAGFGYNHPMVIALMVVNAVNIPVRHISRELESGTMELLLSHPVRRQSLVATLSLSGLIILGLIVLVAFLSSLYGIYLFHTLTWKLTFRVFQISINMWLFSACVLTLTLFICSFSPGGGFTGNLSAMIVFLFYLVFIVSQLWDKLKFTQPYNIFNYYEPSKLMLKQGHFMMDNLVFSALILVFLAGSVWVFGRRDVP